MNTCSKCNKPKATIQQRVIGFPGYRIKGSFIEYCDYCDEPPIVELNPETSFILEKDNGR